MSSLSHLFALCTCYLHITSKMEADVRIPLSNGIKELRWLIQKQDGESLEKWTVFANQFNPGQCDFGLCQIHPFNWISTGRLEHENQRENHTHLNCSFIVSHPEPQIHFFFRFFNLFYPHGMHIQARNKGFVPAQEYWWIRRSYWDMTESSPTLIFPVARIMTKWKHHRPMIRIINHDFFYTIS